MSGPFDCDQVILSISGRRDETAAKQRDVFTATAGQEADCPEYIRMQSSPVYQKHLAIPVNISLHSIRVKQGMACPPCWDCAFIRRLASSQLALAERVQIPESRQRLNELNQGKYWHISIQCGKSESVEETCFGIMRQCAFSQSKCQKGRGSGISCPNACKFPHLHICEKSVSYNNETGTEH